MLLTKLIQHCLQLKEVDAILLIRSGAVYIDGIQRTDPEYPVLKPVAVHAGSVRAWVTPPVILGNGGEYC